MLALHAILFYREWPGIRIGYPDFVIFYTAAHILKQGCARDIYSDSVQESVQRAFAHAVQLRGSILPFNHPPFEAIVFRPFAEVSYLFGYVLWLAINVILILLIVVILRRCLPALANAPIWLWLLAIFGFLLVVVTLIQGQDSVWVLLCYCMAFAAWRRNSEVSAGTWLGLGLCKFHRVLPFMLGPLFQRRWKLVGAFVFTSFVLSLASVGVVGWNAMLRYPSYVWWSEHTQKFRWNFVHGNNPNLRGLILSLMPAHPGRSDQAVVVLASGVLVAFAVYFWQRGGSSTDGRNLVFAGNVVGHSAGKLSHAGA
jgi:hypothetical protein